ncbi:MAG: hypothetical protein EPO61_05435 [Nitrospirae bacterium]|nr:MAG: hypothetical protein EPO61_05435 [Nitrospirota bacterium]
MTDSKPHGSEAQSLEGRIFRPANPKELAEAVEQAFDYRGDITLVLASGATIEGYLFNRTPTGSRPFLQMFPKGQSDERMIEYADIVSISFSGKDTASGKSWESWVEKKESQRRTEAEQAAAEAKARGHL